MPPRAKMPGPATASPNRVAQEATQAPAGARTYETYMNQLSGLRVDPPAAKGPADGAAQPEKQAAASPMPASTGGGAKSDDPFDWSRKLFPAGGDALPPSATSGTGAKPEGRPYELPPNPFVTAGDPRPSSPASGGGPNKPEKPQVETSVTIKPADNKPHGAPVSEADKMQKSQSDYFSQMQQLQMQTNEQQLMTAKLKQDGDMTSALASIIKQGGRGVKDLAAG